MKEKIKKLNKAFKLISQAIGLLKSTFDDNDIDVFIYRLNKANDNLQRFAMKKIEKDYINQEIEKMEKKLRKFE